MIAKQYRLSEKEVKKVLAQRKPFFSHHLVANMKENTLGYGRFALILSAKHAKGSVNRNHYRRLFYTLSRAFLHEIGSIDIVFVGKK
jgi:ribonuclease P protein component